MFRKLQVISGEKQAWTRASGVTGGKKATGGLEQRGTRCNLMFGVEEEEHGVQPKACPGPLCQGVGLLPFPDSHRAPVHIARKENFDSNNSC